MKNLFSHLEPYKIKYLQVSTIHKLYIEESGNPKGKPIIAFHGGPGSRSKPDHRRFYDPKKYRIILFDQRGCGKSTPLGEIKENTTQNLIEDVEKIRIHLKIDAWVVHGGSWGSTLALAYAQKHPHYIKALILRGIFTFRKWEVAWFTGNAKLFFPDVWENVNKVIPKKIRKFLNDYLYDLYIGDNLRNKTATATSFNVWHKSLGKLIPEILLNKDIEPDAIASERILYHYIKHNGFLKEGELLKNAYKIRKIPTVIIQGRYDMCCPPLTAWELHKELPRADFYFIPTAGHKSDEPGITEKIIEYTEKFSRL